MKPAEMTRAEYIEYLRAADPQGRNAAIQANLRATMACTEEEHRARRLAIAMKLATPAAKASIARMVAEVMGARS